MYPEQIWRKVPKVRRVVIFGISSALGLVIFEGSFLSGTKKMFYEIETTEFLGRSSLKQFLKHEIRFFFQVNL